MRKAEVSLLPSGTFLLWAERMGTDITRVKEAVTLLWVLYNFSCLLYAQELSSKHLFQNMKHNISMLIALFKKGNVVHNSTFIAYLQAT